ncbi:MAG: GH36-type glycosyl hydrolase domain-containing protein, partial [Candidatus Binatia bacterium]
MRESRTIARLGASALPVVFLLGGPSSASAASPPPLLSADESPADIASEHGSANFGKWTVDRFGLPAYRYEIDERTAPEAAQVELGGRRDAWHQLGNDHIVANAYNHGYVQLWSQDRLYQWANLYDEANRHFGGGFGYLRLPGRVLSTLHADLPADATMERDFGVGYFRKRTATENVAIEEFVYAPFGDDPLLLHDVAITNDSTAPLEASWFEYWAVNPVIQPLTRRQRGTLPPVYDSAARTLTVPQLPDSGDLSPLAFFAAALEGPVSGYETDADSFFGAGGRAVPQAVLDDRAGSSTALFSPPLLSGKTLLVFRSPVSVPPGETVRLRYAYGVARREIVATLVERHAEAADPLAESSAAWFAWLPRAAFPEAGAWLARELQWDAYMVRSGATYEETFGHHILSQGGYYQYDSGFQGAFRDPLQHMLPMIYAAPELAREVIRYSARQQPAATGFVPYAMLDLGRRFDLGSSNDLDFWLFLATTEYVLATRDFAFLDEVIPYYDVGEATLWEHLKLAFFHQETVVGRGPHGGYVIGLTGDWSDFATQFMQMTESMLVTAQLAFAYPRLALLAERRGDTDFAARLGATAADLHAILDREWTGRGWFSRGYSGVTRLGRGVIYLEPQPWALLAGAASSDQAATLVANIRRFLTGIGAPPELNGPARIGS